MPADGHRSAPRRHHHGRQRALGEGARPAARRRPPRGRRGGAQALRAAGEAGVECLTLYAFSSENWRRPKTEIADLTGLLRFYVQRELDSLHREGVRLKVLGDHNAFEADVARMVDDAVARTAGNSRMTLAIALNYGSRSEMAGAARRLAEQAAAGELGAEEIDEAAIERALDTARPAAARPPDPHLGRATAVQLPALAGGLCRIAVRRHALARFRRATRCARRSPNMPGASGGTAACERRRRPDPASDLPIRFAMGVVMIGVAWSPTIWFGGWWFRALVAAASRADAGRMGGHAQGAAALGLDRRGADAARPCSARRNISMPAAEQVDEIPTI